MGLFKHFILSKSPLNTEGFVAFMVVGINSFSPKLINFKEHNA